MDWIPASRYERKDRPSRNSALELGFWKDDGFGDLGFGGGGEDTHWDGAGVTETESDGGRHVRNGRSLWGCGV